MSCKLAVFVRAILFFALDLSCRGQELYASPAFGAVYTWSGNTDTVTAYVNDTQWIRGSFSGGGSVDAPAGTVSAYVNSFFLNGSGQALQLPVTFTSNGSSGSISGSFPVTLTCSADCTQNTLTVYVDASGSATVASATASPKYFIISLLYDPPGNNSTSSFSNSVSAGSDTNISQNFQTGQGYTLTFGGGFFGSGSSNSITFGTTQSSGDSSSFTTTYQATSGGQLHSNEQPVDHTQYTFYLLLDPSVTVQQTGATSGEYYIGPSVDATGNFESGAAPPDIIFPNVAALESPTTAMPLALLMPQVPQPGTTLPGLAIVCANPLPPSECTQQNACGCAPADFAPIVAHDPLANVTDQTTQPNSVNSARYVYVTDEQLAGPEQSGGAATGVPYSLTDSTVSGYSTSTGTSYSVGYAHQWGLSPLFSLGLTATTTFTYSQTQTFGEFNGQGHTASLVLGSSMVGCMEYVDVYEDATYHTFAFALSAPPSEDCQ